MTVTDIDNIADLSGTLGQPVSGSQSDPFQGYEDYFGFDEVNRYVFPDGRQYIEFKPMAEGARAKYEASTSRDVKFNRRTDDAAIRVDPAADRHALLAASVVGWHVVRRNPASGVFEPVAFSIGRPGCNFEQWLDKANPRIVNELVDAIRKVNPWLTEEMTVEMIDEEMDRLKDLRDQVAEREAAGKSSSNR